MSAIKNPFQRGPSLTSFIFTLVLGLGVFTYAAFSIYARDALWFLPNFEAIPSCIFVRCYGEVVSVEPGSTEFAQ